MNLHVEYEQEEDGRWIAEIPELPGVLCYGVSRVEAVKRVEALALRVLAERLDKGGNARFPYPHEIGAHWLKLLLPLISPAPFVAKAPSSST